MPGSSPGSAGRPLQRAAAEHVQVQVVDRLAGLRPGVGDHAVARLDPAVADQPLLQRHRVRGPGQLAEQLGVGGRQGAQVAVVLLGDDQHVRGGLRVDVAECQCAVGLPDDVGRDLTAHHPAEQAVARPLSHGLDPSQRTARLPARMTPSLPAVPEVSRVRSPAPYEDVVSTPPAVRSGGSAQLQNTLSTAFAERPTEPPTRRVAVAGVLLALVVAVAVLLWAKWIPYQAKVAGLSQSRTWDGSSILTVGDVRPGDAPSWHAATTFSSTYLQAVWKAVVAALLISAAVQAFVPRAWLLRLLNRPGRLRSAAVGGLV